MIFRQSEVSAARQDHPAYGKFHRPGLRWVPISVLLLGAMLAAGIATSSAKEKKPASKTVSGTVFDEAGNPIAGAAIELSDVQTGKMLDEYSQPDGSYQFTDLSFDHDYKIKATYKGRSSEEKHVSSLDSRSRPVMNFTIPKNN